MWKEREKIYIEKGRDKLHNKLMCACNVMKIKLDVSVMMTISRVCELISFHIIIIIRRLMRASCCSPQYLLTCCRKSAISLLISIHLADYSFIFLSHLLIVSTEAAKNDSEGKLKRREKFAKITWLSYIPDISSHLLSGFREFFHYIAPDHDWTSRIILSLIDQSLGWWMVRDQVGIKVFSKKVLL